MKWVISRELARAAFSWNGYLTVAVCLLACALVFAGCVNTTPPANVPDFTATAGDKQVVLAWTLPSDPNFAGVRIQRKTTGAPTSATDGTAAYDGNGATYTDTNLTDGQVYYYGAFSYNANKNFSSGVQASAEPTSATAQASVLSGVADIKASVSSFPSFVFDDPTKAALQADLAQIDASYRAGDVCGAADATMTYLAALQGLHHDASIAAAEILYNSGRMLRFDMLSTASAKGLCPDADRVGVEAAAAMDPQTSNLDQVNATFSFGEPKVFTASGNSGIFTTVNVPGVSAHTTDVGWPAIPVMSQLVAAPEGATVQASAIVEEAEQILMNVIPTQTPAFAQLTAATGDIEPPPFTQDESFYAQDALYPANTVTLTDVGHSRRLHLYRVDVPAGQYDPATNTLHLFKSSKVNITFTGGLGYGTFDPSNLFEPLVTTQNLGILNSSVLNNLQPHPFTGNTEGAELLIVTHAKFLDQANKLATFKTNSGIVTNVIEVGDSSTPSSSDIRNLIVNYWNNSQIQFSYVLQSAM